jgi:hypothetical protein
LTVHTCLFPPLGDNGADLSIGASGNGVERIVKGLAERGEGILNISRGRGGFSAAALETSVGGATSSKECPTVVCTSLTSRPSFCVLSFV